jgi:hypothetical protein
MNDPQVLELTPREAADRIRSELATASKAFQAAEADAGVAACACALGLALQLGPEPTGQVLLSVLEEAQSLARRSQADALSSLGPAVIGLIGQVREAQALPTGAGMIAWASVGEELGTLLGQVGLALSIPSHGRSGMVAAAMARADGLDEATGRIFDLRGWLESLELNVT